MYRDVWTIYRMDSRRFYREVNNLHIPQDKRILTNHAQFAARTSFDKTFKDQSRALHSPNVFMPKMIF